jgi:hypothetical protein
MLGAYSPGPTRRFGPIAGDRTDPAPRTNERRQPPFRGQERSFRMNTVSRRSFLKTAGLATGAAALAASPSAGAAMQPNPLETTPSGPLPHEPIVAVIRNADRGEVTVLSGRTEKTYRDKVLVRRLLEAAEQNHATTKKQGVA